ncbi:MAG: CPBP family intramembrane metalloprotease [Oscillospiraceae bacterium]|nr:CPBP family intramembrane metalloprotease [Oscillospiraceae bacterium]
MKPAAKRETLDLCIGMIGSFIGLTVLITAVIPLVLPMPLILRMLLLLVTYWLTALAPLIIIRYRHDSLHTYGLRRRRLPQQILIGIVIGGALALLLVMPPYSLGLGELWDNGCRFGHDLWRYLYELCYKTLAIGAAEEFVFRGFCLTKLRRIFKADVPAIALSSLLFGLFHLFGGSIVQIILTAFIGAVLAVCRQKIKNCTLLSVIIAHGLYDFIISCAASLTHLQ